MPKWKDIGPYRCFFYSNEGSEPPHIHVARDDNEAKFWLSDFSVAHNFGFPAHEIGAIIRELKPQTAEILRAWNEHFGN